MRLFRSFILRIAQILFTTGFICVVLMIATLFLQQINEPIADFAILGGVLLAGSLFSQFIIRKLDSELSAQAARLIYPAGAILSITLSVVLSINLSAFLEEGARQHLVLILAGIGVAVFMVVRCFDIQWLPSEEEVLELEKARQ